jgi:histidine phosphotransfer protein HptB
MIDRESPGCGEWKLPDELRQMAEGGDVEVVREVLTIFRTDTATRLQSIQAALASGNSAQVRMQAHTIKGSASQVGAMGLAELCRRIEREAAEGRTAGLPALIGELETCVAAVSRAIAAGQDALK